MDSGLFERLFSMLYERSFIYRDDPPFVLVSGIESCYYFDCKATTLSQDGLALIGPAVYSKIESLVKSGGIDAIGGLTLGADPISLSTSIEAYKNGCELSPLIVRKEPKSHGTERWIEGSIENVKNTIVVDDVITTGGSTIKAIERLRESGLNVLKAIVIIDREEGGKENIEKTGVKVSSLYTRSDFNRRRLEELGMEQL